MIPQKSIIGIILSTHIKKLSKFIFSHLDVQLFNKATTFIKSQGSIFILVCILKFLPQKSVKAFSFNKLIKNQTTNHLLHFIFFLLSKTSNGDSQMGQGINPTVAFTLILSNLNVQLLN